MFIQLEGYPVGLFKLSKHDLDELQEHLKLQYQWYTCADNTKIQETMDKYLNNKNYYL